MDANGRGGYLVFRWSTAGYTLEERSGDPPAAGEQVEDGDSRFRVAKMAPSPLPGDRRIACTSARINRWLEQASPSGRLATRGQDVLDVRARSRTRR